MLGSARVVGLVLTTVVAFSHLPSSVLSWGSESSSAQDYSQGYSSGSADPYNPYSQGSDRSRERADNLFTRRGGNRGRPVYDPWNILYKRPQVVYSQERIYDGRRGQGPSPGRNPYWVPAPMPQPPTGHFPYPRPIPSPPAGPYPFPKPSPQPEPSLGPRPRPIIEPYPDPSTGPFPNPANGPFPHQGNGPFPHQGNGPFPHQGNGPFPHQGNGPFPHQNKGPFPHIGNGPRPYIPDQPNPYLPGPSKPYRPVNPNPYPTLDPIGPKPYQPVNPKPYLPVDPNPYLPYKPVGPKPPHPEDPKPYQPVDPKPYQPVDPKPYQPVDPKPYQPVYPTPYQPVDPKPYQPTDPKPYQPVDPKPYQPVDPKPYQPVDPKPYQPVDPKPYQPVDPKPYQPVDPKPYQPVDPKPYQPVDPKPYQPVDPKPYQPVDPKPYQPVDPKPYQPVDPKPYQPTDPNPYLPYQPAGPVNPPVDPYKPAHPRPYFPTEPKPTLPSNPNDPYPSGPRPRPQPSRPVRPSLPSSLCDNCRFKNGVGYNPFPNSCQDYVTCQPYKGYKLLPTKMSCPYNLFWSQRLLTCVRPKDTKCRYDACLKGGKTAPVYGNCAAYHVCDGYKHTSAIYCCAYGYRYQNGYGYNKAGAQPCVRDPTCLDSCAPKKNPVVKERCRLYAVPGYPFKYNEAVHGKYLTRSCAPGTAFVQKECGCTKRVKIAPKGCGPEVFIDFKYGIRDVSGNFVSIGNEWNKVKSVKTSGARDGFAGEFAKGQLILWRFANAPLGPPLKISFTFVEKAFKSGGGQGGYGGKEILVSNGDCGKGPSVSITFDRSSRTVTALVHTKSSYKSFKPVTVSVPYAAGEYKQVTYSYDGKYLTLTVNSQSSQRTKSVAVYGKVLVSHCALSIGGVKGATNFYGIIDDFSLSLCAPKPVQPRPIPRPFPRSPNPNNPGANPGGPGSYPLNRPGVPYPDGSHTNKLPSPYVPDQKNAYPHW